jgi:hypothetical protein
LKSGIRIVYSDVDETLSDDVTGSSLRAKKIVAKHFPAEDQKKGSSKKQKLLLPVC